MLRRRQYRDLSKWRVTAKRQKDKYYSRSQTGHGTPRWTSEEDLIVLLHEKTDNEIALEIGRSVAAIQKRRGVLKRRGITLENCRSMTSE